MVCNVFFVDGNGIGIRRRKGLEPVTRPVRYTSADAMYITIFTAVSSHFTGK
jgi:hypothetical protein